MRDEIKNNDSARGLCQFPPAFMPYQPTIMTPKKIENVILKFFVYSLYIAKKLTSLTLFLSLFTAPFAFLGCGAYTTQEVLIPVKCQVEKMPVAPKRDSNDFQSLKDNLEYYEAMELIALECAEEIKK